MHRREFTIIGVLMATLSAAAAAGPSLAPAPLFCDRMVLQRDVPLPVWGQAAPGAKVEVRLAGRVQSATADAQGKWSVTLEPLAAGGPFEMTITGGQTLVLRDILVGEVWLCSGQSNMWWPVKNAADAAKEIAGANDPNIRMFTVAHATAPDGPRDRCEGAWRPASPETVGRFSAAGYFFGRSLRRELNVPIGLINSSVGATTAEAWTSRKALAADPATAPRLAYWAGKVKAFDPAAAEATNARKLAEWKAAVAKARTAGRTPPRRPRPIIAPTADKNYPATLYNGMIAPLIPYAMRGAIWYQGESNAGRPEQYRRLFPLMIQDWRKRWGQGEFPFYFVQLANFITPKRWGDCNWAYLREAQEAALALPNTGMAVTIDIGDPNNIHPANKQEAGARLARWALAKVYGRTIPFSGPAYRSMAVDGGEIRLRFEFADGLAARGGGRLDGFLIAGADKKFFPAEAVIDDETVVVSSKQVAAPVAIRYAWSSNPAGANLVNNAGLPAGSFRTDDWPRMNPKR